MSRRSIVVSRTADDPGGEHTGDGSVVHGRAHADLADELADYAV
jgi:hypothetical protein